MGSQGLTCSITQRLCRLEKNDRAILKQIVENISSQLAGKADSDLGNVSDESVTTDLMAPASVTLAKLAADVIAALGGNQDPAKFIGLWNPATNTPSIPTAAGHAGEWYQVFPGGTATVGNAPAGPYNEGDYLVNPNGTAWIRQLRPSGYIADGSLPWLKLEETIVQTDIWVDVGGTQTLISWGVYAPDINGDNQLQFGITPDRLFVSEHIAAIDGLLDSLSPLLAYLSDGGIAPQKVAYTVVGDLWIDLDGEPAEVGWGVGSADGSTVKLGVTTGGRTFAFGLDGAGSSTSYVLYPQDGGGIGTIDRDSSGPGTVLVDDGAEWRDLQHLTGDIWLGTSNRLGTRLMFRVDAQTGRVLPMNQAIVFGVGGTGQSLWVGTNASPAITTASAHPGYNLMFSAGHWAGTQGVVLDGATLTSFVNMVEASRESPASGMLNWLQTRNQDIFGARIIFHYANSADGGTLYTAIKKGTQPYTNWMTAIQRAQIVAAGRGEDYLYLFTPAAHGEADESAGTSAATYQANMAEFCADLAADAKAITGQTYTPIVVASQTSSHLYYNHATPTVAAGQLAAALSAAEFILACPKYHLEYSDGLHLTNEGSLILGEYVAKAAERTVFGEGKFFPLYPLSAIQSAGKVTITFHVPVGGLVFDTDWVSDPGDKGFRLPGATITSVTIVGNTVEISFTGGPPTSVDYAWTGTLGAPSGPTTGARGCLFDDDDVLSKTGRRLRNPCVHFSLPL